MPGGENGTIMKKSDVNERNALRELLTDPLRNFVPEFKREVDHEGHGKEVAYYSGEERGGWGGGGGGG